jgi:PAS domain S-box-containing protein
VIPKFWLLFKDRCLDSCVNSQGKSNVDEQPINAQRHAKKNFTGYQSFTKIRIVRYTIGRSAVMKFQQPILNVFGWRKHKSRSNPTQIYGSYPSPPESRHNGAIPPQLPSIPTSEFDCSGSSIYSMSMATSRSNTLRPTTNDSSWPASPKADSLAPWSEAAWEPLVNDTKPDMIPPSVRPINDTHRDQYMRSASKDSGVLLYGDFYQHEDTLRPKTAPGRELDHTSFGYKQFGSQLQHEKFSPSSVASWETSPRPSTVSSNISFDTSSSSYLPPLQSITIMEEEEGLDSILEDDPESYDLVPPPNMHQNHGFVVEKRAEELFSTEHLQEIFKEPDSMLKFTKFLSSRRPSSVPLLIYYLDAVKALKAINYSNAIAEALAPIPSIDFTHEMVTPTLNNSLQNRAKQSFDIMVQNDLPAYITHVYIQIINRSLFHKITGQMSASLREASEGLAEVFCLTDPSREDNPVVFASEEFHRTTQYGVDYSIGRNCRFLQGPKTSPNSIKRISDAVKEGEEVNELVVNYRRDGSAFMNLVTVSPLTDSKGQIRYFIGAQVDVTGLCRDCTELDSLKRLLDRRSPPRSAADSLVQKDDSEDEPDEFRELTEMFNDEELEVVQKYGGRMQEKFHILEKERKRVVVTNESSTIPRYTPIGMGPNTSLFQNVSNLFHLRCSY